MYLKMGIGADTPNLSENLVNIWAGKTGINRPILDELFNTKQDVIFSSAHFEIMRKLTGGITAIAKQYKK